MQMQGPVLCLCGFGPQLAVFYHKNGGIDVEIIEISSTDNMRKRVLNISVPLTPNSKLEWAGFDTESGALVTIDTKGMTRILMSSLGSMGWNWMPVLDLFKVHIHTY